MAELHLVEDRPGPEWDRAVELLMGAAAASGLLGEDGEAQCRATIQSGLVITRRKVKPEERRFEDAMWDAMERSERIGHNGGPALGADEWLSN
jgi:hypothetical protein